MIRSSEQIKGQLEFWFFKYFSKTKEEFNGKEKFTLFELIDSNLKEKLIALIDFTSYEIPVFVLRVSKENYVITTTERFVKLDGSKVDLIGFRDFSGHDGYKEVIMVRKWFRKVADVKVEGFLKEFEIKKKRRDSCLLDNPDWDTGVRFLECH